MSGTLTIGIDGGINGGIVALDNNGDVKHSIVMPITKEGQLDIGMLKQLFSITFNIPNLVVYFEQAAPRAVSGKRQCFKTGMMYGQMIGLLEGLGIRYVIVGPQKWQKGILGETHGNSKALSIEYCTKRYPNENWYRTKRCKTVHNGLTDACCLALFGWKRECYHE